MAPEADQLGMFRQQAIDRFQHFHKTPFNPNSRVDNDKLQQMIKYQQQMGPMSIMPGGQPPSAPPMSPNSTLAKAGSAPVGALAGATEKLGPLWEKARGFLGKAHESVKGTGKLGIGLSAGGLGLAGGAIAGNQVGHANGMNEGVTAGVDAGMERGVNAAQASQPGDPGVLGRLLDVFRGQSQGPDSQTVLRNLQGDKDSLIKSILAGRPTASA